MTKNKKSERLHLMSKLYSYHLKYKTLKKNSNKIKLLELVTPIIEKSNIDKTFAETFIVYGNRFLKHETGYTYNPDKNTFQ